MYVHIMPVSMLILYPTTGRSHRKELQTIFSENKCKSGKAGTTIFACTASQVLKNNINEVKQLWRHHGVLVDHGQCRIMQQLCAFRPLAKLWSRGAAITMWTISSSIPLSRRLEVSFFFDKKMQWCQILLVRGSGDPCARAYLGRGWKYIHSMFQLFLIKRKVLISFLSYQNKVFFAFKRRLVFRTESSDRYSILGTLLAFHLLLLKQPFLGRAPFLFFILYLCLYVNSNGPWERNNIAEKDLHGHKKHQRDFETVLMLCTCSWLVDIRKHLGLMLLIQFKNWPPLWLSPTSVTLAPTVSPWIITASWKHVSTSISSVSIFIVPHRYCSNFKGRIKVSSEDPTPW